MSEFSRLPERPSLEQLQKQAKDLLRDSRASGQETTLADAQFALARKYAFDSWGALKRRTEELRQPIYQLDEENARIVLRGPCNERDWDAVCALARERQVTRLQASGLTDTGAALLARMPKLEELEMGSMQGVITDRGLEVLRALPRLKKMLLYWLPKISDAGAAHLSACGQLEVVNLMGTHTGDGAVRALAGKPKLSRLKTGRNVTDAGLVLLHEFPIFKTWHGGDLHYGLLSPDAGPNHLLVDGPFTNAGIASLVGLDGLFGLSFFWHCSGFTGEGLAPLKELPNLGMLGCEGKRCDDEAMRHIAALPKLRMLMAQGTVASDAGFAALSKSQSIEYIWGRECPNLTGAGFRALSEMPALRGLAVSCKNVDNDALSLLPHFPSLKELTPIGMSDDAFRYVGQCEKLERLACMYCRDTGDVATAHIAGLPNLKSYYAGETQITDRSLEMLGHMQSLEKIEFWNCKGVTDAGVAHLARLPRLREISLDGLPGVSRAVVRLFGPQVRVSYS